VPALKRPKINKGEIMRYIESRTSYKILNKYLTIFSSPREGCGIVHHFFLFGEYAGEITDLVRNGNGWDSTHSEIDSPTDIVFEDNYGKMYLFSEISNVKFNQMDKHLVFNYIPHGKNVVKIYNKYD
jgi:hypothetical protein